MNVSSRSKQQPVEGAGLPGCPNAAVVASMIGYYTLVGAAGLSAIFLR